MTFALILLIGGALLGGPVGFAGAAGIVIIGWLLRTAGAGVVQAQEAKKYQLNHTVCPHCKEEVKVDATVCWHCNTPLEPDHSKMEARDKAHNPWTNN